MKIYHESRVEPADIDNLGHMNVRIYAKHAALATHKLAASLGLDDAMLLSNNARIELPDAHTRFHHEQMEGAPLGVRAGIVATDKHHIDAYLELFNRETERLSATFWRCFSLVDRNNRTPLPFNEETLARARDLIVDVPDHGKPRSLTLDPIRNDTTPGDLESRGIEARFQGYQVKAEDCTPEGFMDLSQGPWLAFAKMPIKYKPTPEEKADSWFTDGRVSIATLESRQVVFDVPRLGDTVISYTGIADIAAKTMQFRHWSFIKGTGKLVAVLAEMGIGIDLQARKSVEFPPAMRAKLEERSHPELV